MRRDAKNGRARPGYFINISFRCLSLPRCSGGAARQRRRPASGHRYPLLPLHEERAHKAGEKVERARKNPWKRREDEYIYIYRGEEGRRCSIPGARSWCTLLHRKTERSRGDSFFTFLPPLPRKQGRSFREYNPCYRLLSGRNDDFLVHPSFVESFLESFETWQRWMPLDGLWYLSMCSSRDTWIRRIFFLEMF